MRLLPWLLKVKHLITLDHPIVRLASEDVPVPYARVLEQAVLPDVEKIKAAIIKSGQ